MSTAELRVSLIDRIMLMEEDELKKMLALVDREQGDWWYELSDEERREIEEGIKQADEGQLTDHKDVMKVFEKWR